MMVRDPAGYVFAPAPASSSRAMSRRACRAGELAGFLHFVEDVDSPPIELRYGATASCGCRPGPAAWSAATPSRW